MVLAYVSVMWLGMSSQLAKGRGLIPEKQLKPIRVDECLNRFNVTVFNVTMDDVTNQEYIHL